MGARKLVPGENLTGDIAQLGERGVRNAEVEGSSPSISTIQPL